MRMQRRWRKQALSEPKALNHTDSCTAMAQNGAWKNVETGTADLLVHGISSSKLS
jgi:hypothetical protein